ncbi:glycosyltransferase family 4 protein [Rhizobium sp. S-51]|uniref:Glycosyltransferase family 4 protein n=1 Tax=Rhizobium terricola TaxID=2728849 RepID=A0A7Y0B0C9_9HYPH|nr:glycosyltransferase family 4 protein [Rhizobium terricola]NML76780.1 glycosyltransferase family 4 protein [Rhizobium terricola]
MAHQPDRVVIINDRSTTVGGASNLAILSAGLLESRGVKVTYVSGDHPGPLKPANDTINLAGTPLTQQGRLAAFSGGIYNQKAYEVLHDLIAAEDTPSTIYHVHGWSKILSPSIFRALSDVRERTILHAHDYFLACPNGGFANYRTQTICDLKPMSAQCLMTQCDKRGYHEKLWRSARHFLREHFYPTHDMPANIVVVHEQMRAIFERCGINIEHVDTIRNPADPFVTEELAPWTQRTFYFIGRLEPEKGFEEAAKAARLANARLHVIGDGAGRAMLEHDYPEILIHGWQSREGLRAIVRDARAIVISSRVPEPFGLAAIEAIGSGIPVIMPDSALLAEEIAAQGCGLNFKNGSVESLADGLRRMASDDELIRTMSLNCRHEASGLAHTASTWIEALISLYGRILSEANRPATPHA